MIAIPSSQTTTAPTQGHGHVIPLQTYLLIWGALMGLTVLTVVVSRFDFGSLNTLIAMLVATIKGSLVALYFMHLRYDNKFNLIILLASLFFVALFFIPTIIDMLTRGDIDPIRNEIPDAYKVFVPPAVDASHLLSPASLAH